MSEAIVITGPTASGKSYIAMQLAQGGRAEIINADALQVYENLRILTARPTATEEAAVPHHLYGEVAGEEAWSAGTYARAAAERVEDVIARGKTPLVVGGTGLWLKALVEGLSPIPDVPPSIMAEARQRHEQMGRAAFREEVLAADPGMGWLSENDTQRHLRAWSVYRATGRALSHWQKRPPLAVTDVKFHAFVFLPERTTLYARCDERFHKMLDDGAVEEVETLLSLNLPLTLPVMKSVGVPELTAYIRGEVSLEEARLAAQQATRRLAKRQITWFRGQAADWPCFGHTEDMLDKIRQCLNDN
ncbi:MAG: tRNA (adenosine(37)-N6)-dimethylallyltransferase MiaA [Pseudomonadota bacterium]